MGRPVVMNFSKASPSNGHGQPLLLKIDQDKAFQDVVVKHEVYIKMSAFDVEIFLPCDKGKASAQLQQKFL